MLFNGKKKAITFSYDDGVTQDKKLVEILNRYHLRGTFNINSELLGQKAELERGGTIVNHTKIRPEEVAEVYKDHEIAAHTLTHPLLPGLPPEEIVRQVEQDRKNLSILAGYEVIGMAYPGGGVNHDARVVETVRKHTGIRYARTITSTHCFEPPADLLELNPSVYHIMETDKLFALGEQFLNLKPDKPQIFYIWGHSYEFDIADTWQEFETFCRMISNQEDIFYGTNAQVFCPKLV